MLNVFAPVFGEFVGIGFLADGTECVAKFSAHEIIPGCCLGMRLQLIKKDNHDAIVNAFLTVTQNRKSGELEMSLLDPKESFGELRREAREQDHGIHHYIFSARRSRHGSFRLSFDLASSSQFKIMVELSPSDDPQGASFHKAWEASLERSVVEQRESILSRLAA